MVKIPFPDISFPQTQSVNYSVYHCAKCGDLKQMIDKSNVLKFGPVSEQGAETRFHKESAIFF